MLKTQNPFGHGGGRRQVIGRQRLALQNGEVQLDLVQPTGMGRQHDRYRIGIPTLQPGRKCVGMVRRTVVDNPKHAMGAAVRLTLHDHVDQPVERHDTCRGVHPAEDLTREDIQGS